MSLLSDDYGETSMYVQQMPKALLFDKLKRVVSALPLVQAADKPSDSQAATTVSQSPDSSGILAESSIRSTLKQTESAKTLSNAVIPELLNCSSSKETECIKYTPERLTVRRKGSDSKLKTCVKNPVVRLSRISQNKHSVVSYDNDLADGSHEEQQFHTCSPFKSSKLQQVLDKLNDTLDKTNNNPEKPYSSSGISVPHLMPSSEFLSPQTLAFKSESISANDRLFNRKTRMTVCHAAPMSVGKEAYSSSSEDVHIQSSSDEVFESRPTASVERTSNMNLSGTCSFVRYFVNV